MRRSSPAWPARFASRGSGRARRPRKVLEARIGQGYARGEAFREALPNYYSAAVREHEVDVIAPPEIDITAGEEEGAGHLRRRRRGSPVGRGRATTTSRSRSRPSRSATMTSMRPSIGCASQFSDLESVDRAAADGDTRSSSISPPPTRAKPIPGMTTDDYNYQVGSGATGIDEFDENLTGASEGRRARVRAPTHPDEDEENPIQFSITVTDVQETGPPRTDARRVGLGELRVRRRSTSSGPTTATGWKMSRGSPRPSNARQNNLAEKVSELVDDELVPDATGRGRGREPHPGHGHAAPGPGHRVRPVHAVQRPGPPGHDAGRDPDPGPGHGQA